MPDDQASDVDLLVYFAVVSPKVVQKWKPVTSARQNLKIVNIYEIFLISFFWLISLESWRLFGGGM